MRMWVPTTFMNSILCTWMHNIARNMSDMIKMNTHTHLYMLYAPLLHDAMVWMQHRQWQATENIHWYSEHISCHILDDFHAFSIYFFFSFLRCLSIRQGKRYSFIYFQMSKWIKVEEKNEKKNNQNSQYITRVPTAAQETVFFRVWFERKFHFWNESVKKWSSRIAFLMLCLSAIVLPSYCSYKGMEFIWYNMEVTDTSSDSCLDGERKIYREIIAIEWTKVFVFVCVPAAFCNCVHMKHAYFVSLKLHVGRKMPDWEYWCSNSISTRIHNADKHTLPRNLQFQISSRRM